MQKENANMTAEDLMEQARFIESFDLAMKQIDKNIKAERRKLGGPAKRTAYDEIKDAGNWNAEWVSGQFVLIVARQSELSQRLRRFITRVGYEAKAQYDAKYDNGEEAAEK